MPVTCKLQSIKNYTKVYKIIKCMDTIVDLNLAMNIKVKVHTAEMTENWTFSVVQVILTRLRQ